MLDPVDRALLRVVCMFVNVTLHEQVLRSFSHIEFSGQCLSTFSFKHEFGCTSTVIKLTKLAETSGRNKNKKHIIFCINNINSTLLHINNIDNNAISFYTRTQKEHLCILHITV